MFYVVINTFTLMLTSLCMLVAYSEKGAILKYKTLN
jgi:hypothetical protein